MMQIMTGNVSSQNVIVRKRLSKVPSEYLNLVPQAVGTLHLIRIGENVHAGQSISYVWTGQQNVECETRALPAELFGSEVKLDTGPYVDLLISCVRNLWDPLGFDEEPIRATIGLCLQ
jgi:DNA polymerase elongation subunit (family B)